MEISRDKYLNDLVVRKGNGMIKVVTGIRRCGKPIWCSTCSSVISSSRESRKTT